MILESPKESHRPIVLLIHSVLKLDSPGCSHLEVILGFLAVDRDRGLLSFSYKISRAARLGITVIFWIREMKLIRRRPRQDKSAQCKGCGDDGKGYNELTGGSLIHTLSVGRGSDKLGV